MANPQPSLPKEVFGRKYPQVPADDRSPQGYGFSTEGFFVANFDSANGKF